MITPLTSPLSDTTINVTSVYNIIADMMSGFSAGGWTITTYYSAHARLSDIFGPPTNGATFYVGGQSFQFWNTSLLMPGMWARGNIKVDWVLGDDYNNLVNLATAMLPYFGGSAGYTIGYDSLGQLYVEFTGALPHIAVSVYTSFNNQSLWDTTYTYGHGFIATSQTFRGNTIQLKVLSLDALYSYSMQVLSPVVTPIYNCVIGWGGVPPASYCHLVVNKYQAIYYPVNPGSVSYPPLGRFFPFILSLPWTPVVSQDNYFILLCIQSYAFTRRLTIDYPSNSTYGINYWAKTWNGTINYGPASMYNARAAKFLVPGWGGNTDPNGLYNLRKLIRDTDEKALITEPLIAVDSPSLIVGQLWDAFITTEVTALEDTATYLGHTYRVAGIDLGNYMGWELKAQLYLRVT